jgi:hypothetical protein
MFYALAGSLFEKAVQECKKVSSTAHNETERAALASILFAMISTEAFINELGLLVSGEKDHLAVPGWERTLSDLLDEAEKSRISITSKYQLAKFILSGQPFDRGSKPFQDFALLVDVRNLLVHARPLTAIVRKNPSGGFEWAEPKIMVRLQNASALEVDDFLLDAASMSNADALAASLVLQISRQSVARWACKAAAGIVNGILDAAPNDEFGHFYRRDFECPEMWH